MLLLFLAATMGAGVVTPPTPPVNNYPPAGSSSVSRRGSHIELTEEHKRLIERIVKGPEQKEQAIELPPKIEIEGVNWTDEELQMIALLLAEL